MIGGFVTVGPNAVLALARDGYRRSTVNPRDLWDAISFKGFRSMLRQNARPAFDEACSSLSRRAYLKLCRRYCPELELDDLEHHPAGIRAQAVMLDGSLVHDFLIRRSSRSLHICNAPSPAATSALPIGNFIANEVEVALTRAGTLRAQR